MSTKTLPATDVIGLSSDVKRAAVFPFPDIFCRKTRYAGHSMETALRLLALITVLHEAASIMVENCRAHVTECRVSRKSSTAITLSECLNISHQHATNNSGLITFPDLTLLVDTTDVVATCTGLTRTLSSSESFSSRFRCRRLTRGDWHAGVKATSRDTRLHHTDFNRQSVIHFVVRFNWKCEKIRANARAVGNMRTTGNANAALSMNARVVVCQTHDSTTMQSRWRCSTRCALSCSRRPRSECLFFRVQCLIAKSLHGRPCYQHCNTNPKSPSASGVLDGVQQKKTVNQAVGFCSYTNIKANAIRGETYDKIDRVGLALGVSSALFAKTTRLFDCTQGRKNESVSMASSLAFQTPVDEQHAVKTDVFAINMSTSLTIHFCVSPFLSLALARALFCPSSLSTLSLIRFCHLRRPVHQ